MSKNKKKKANITNIDENITAAMGSMKSIILHTIIFAVFLTLPAFTDLTYEFVLIILTTVVSLEAIYLALFIQISLNRQGQEIEEIAEDVEEIAEDVEEIQEDVEEIQEDVDEIEKEVEEIADDVDEDTPEFISEEKTEKQRKEAQKKQLENIENMLAKLLAGSAKK